MRFRKDLGSQIYSTYNDLDDYSDLEDESSSNIFGNKTLRKSNLNLNMSIDCMNKGFPQITIEDLSKNNNKGFNYDGKFDNIQATHQ